MVLENIKTIEMIDKFNMEESLATLTLDSKHFMIYQTAGKEIMNTGLKKIMKNFSDISKSSKGVNITIPISQLMDNKYDGDILQYSEYIVKNQFDFLLMFGNNLKLFYNDKAIFIQNTAMVMLSSDIDSNYINAHLDTINVKIQLPRITDFNLLMKVILTVTYFPFIDVRYLSKKYNGQIDKVLFKSNLEILMDTKYSLKEYLYDTYVNKYLEKLIRYSDLKETVDILLYGKSLGIDEEELNKLEEFNKLREKALKYVKWIFNQAGLIVIREPELIEELLLLENRFTLT